MQFVIVGKPVAVAVLLARRREIHMQLVIVGKPVAVGIGVLGIGAERDFVNVRDAVAVGVEIRIDRPGFFFRFGFFRLDFFRFGFLFRFGFGFRFFDGRLLLGSGGFIGLIRERGRKSGEYGRKQHQSRDQQGQQSVSVCHKIRVPLSVLCMQRIGLYILFSLYKIRKVFGNRDAEDFCDIFSHRKNDAEIRTVPTDPFVPPQHTVEARSVPNARHIDKTSCLAWMRLLQ